MRSGIPGASSAHFLTLAATALVAGSIGCSPLRTIDGTENNESDPAMGSVGIALLRMADDDYGDGISELAGAHRPSPRVISNEVCAQDELIPNDRYASDMVWQWGQFLDHDIDLTEGVHPEEPADIEVPLGDKFFDPYSTGIATIGFNRSIYVEGSEPRQQKNEITAWIDGSNVYGSDQERADALRAHDGKGRLMMSKGRLLPFNTFGLPNAGGSDDETLFLSGDLRANEQVYLTAMHTLWAREHNRWAKLIHRLAPDASGDEIYEAARIMVTAELQAITYNEFLPILLGKRAMGKYEGYDGTIDGSILNEFSTAAFRFGHSMLSPTLLRLNRKGKETRYGHLALRDAFFRPDRLTNEGGIEPMLRGLAAQRAQNVDPYIIDDVRNFLFGPPGAGGFDLASLNIQRGRDHGLASYNDTREALDLGRAASFADVSSDPEIQARLAAAYDHVDDIDLWVGGLSEDHVDGALVGELVHTILTIQFKALRDGDRFWYERVLPKRLVRFVDKTRLSDVILRNTRIRRGEIPRDVFRVAKKRDERGHHDDDDD